MKLLSAVVPCFNEEENIDYFYSEFLKNKPFFDENGIDYELIYVDDGSKDKTAEKVKALHKRDDKVTLLSFSRNFGKEAAMYAGMQNAKGDFVAIMDADLQDPPSLLPEMFQYIFEGYDQVATRRVTREGEPPIRSWFARRFYHLINKFSKTEIVDGSRDFRLMTRQVVNSILQVTEYNRFSKGLFSWVGYRTKWIALRMLSGSMDRQSGHSSLSFCMHSMGSLHIRLCHLPLQVFWHFILCHCVFYDHFHYRSETGVWRSNSRVAIDGLYHVIGWRHPTSVHWHYRDSTLRKHILR